MPQLACQNQALTMGGWNLVSYTVGPTVVVLRTHPTVDISSINPTVVILVYQPSRFHISWPQVHHQFSDPRGIYGFKSARLQSRQALRCALRQPSSLRVK